MLSGLSAGSGRAGAVQRRGVRVERDARQAIEGLDVPCARPRHDLVGRLAAVKQTGGDDALLEDSAHLLLDEARILDGEPPQDAKAFSERLARVMSRGLA